jgi:hypothetical protein
MSNLGVVVAVATIDRGQAPAVTVLPTLPLQVWWEASVLIEGGRLVILFLPGVGSVGRTSVVGIVVVLMIVKG